MVRRAEVPSTLDSWLEALFFYISLLRCVKLCVHSDSDTRAGKQWGPLSANMTYPAHAREFRERQAVKDTTAKPSSVQIENLSK